MTPNVILLTLVAAVVVVAGYLLVMRVFFRDSKELDKKIDYSKMKEWKDDED
jgi:low affinity Fe/Cu permease